MAFILGYLLAINALGAVLVVLDKKRAQRGAWRVPERTLFTLCALGGCPGVYLSMRRARHKTLHKRFMWGIPAILLAQIVIISLIYYLLFKGGFNQ